MFTSDYFWPEQIFFTKLFSLMKRSILLGIWAVFTASMASAQVDIKVGPLGLLFSNLNLGIEFGAAQNIGIEVTPGIDWGVLSSGWGAVADNDYKATALRIGLNGRYYFKATEKRLDGFYAGIYSRYGGGKYSYTDPDTNEKDEFKSTRVAGGFLIGGKIISSNERIIFDLGIGLGRAFVYRFEDQNGSEEVDFSDIPFANFDMPINLKIGFRIGGKREK